MAVPAAAAALVSGLSWLRSHSASAFPAALAAVAALPLDCQLASSQTLHICLGWAPPVSLFPGCGPIGVCWAWFVIGLVVGVCFAVMCYLVWLLFHLLRHYNDGQRPQMLPVDARVELLQLFVAGGQDLLHNVAQQHGVEPSELLRQCIHGVRVHPQPLPNARRARPPPQPVPVRNPLLR